MEWWGITALIIALFTTSLYGLSLKCGEEIVIKRGEKKVLRFWSSEDELLNVDVISKLKRGESQQGQSDVSDGLVDGGSGVRGEGGGIRDKVGISDGIGGGTSPSGHFDDSNSLRTGIEDGDVNGDVENKNDLYYGFGTRITTLSPSVGGEGAGSSEGGAVDGQGSQDQNQQQQEQQEEGQQGQNTDSSGIRQGTESTDSKQQETQQQEEEQQQEEKEKQQEQQTDQQEDQHISHTTTEATESTSQHQEQEILDTEKIVEGEKRPSVNTVFLDDSIIYDFSSGDEETNDYHHYDPDSVGEVQNPHLHGENDFKDDEETVLPPDPVAGILVHHHDPSQASFPDNPYLAEDNNGETLTTILPSHEDSAITIPPSSKDSVSTIIPSHRDSSTTILPLHEESATTILPSHEDSATTIPPSSKDSVSTMSPSHRDSSITTMPSPTDSSTTVMSSPEESATTSLPSQKDPSSTIMPSNRESSTTITPPQNPTTTDMPPHEGSSTKIPPPADPSTTIMPLHRYSTITFPPHHDQTTTASPQQDLFTTTQSSHDSTAADFRVPETETETHGPEGAEEVSQLETTLVPQAVRETLQTTETSETVEKTAETAEAPEKPAAASEPVHTTAETSETLHGGATETSETLANAATEASPPETFQTTTETPGPETLRIEIEALRDATATPSSETSTETHTETPPPVMTRVGTETPPPEKLGVTTETPAETSGPQTLREATETPAPAAQRDTTETLAEADGHETLKEATETPVLETVRDATEIPSDTSSPEVLKEATDTPAPETLRDATETPAPETLREVTETPTETSVSEILRGVDDMPTETSPPETQREADATPFPLWQREATETPTPESLNIDSETLTPETVRDATETPAPESQRATTETRATEAIENTSKATSLETPLAVTDVPKATEIPGATKTSSSTFETTESSAIEAQPIVNTEAITEIPKSPTEIVASDNAEFTTESIFILNEAIEYATEHNDATETNYAVDTNTKRADTGSIAEGEKSSDGQTTEQRPTTISPVYIQDDNQQTTDALTQDAYPEADSQTDPAIVSSTVKPSTTPVLPSNPGDIFHSIIDRLTAALQEPLTEAQESESDVGILNFSDIVSATVDDLGLTVNSENTPTWMLPAEHRKKLPSGGSGTSDPNSVMAADDLPTTTLGVTDDVTEIPASTTEGPVYEYPQLTQEEDFKGYDYYEGLVDSLVAKDRPYQGDSGTVQSTTITYPAEAPTTVLSYVYPELESTSGDSVPSGKGESEGNYHSINFQNGVRRVEEATTVTYAEFKDITTTATTTSGVDDAGTATTTTLNSTTAFSVPLVVLRNQEMLNNLLNNQNKESSKVVITEQGSRVSINSATSSTEDPVDGIATTQWSSDNSTSTATDQPISLVPVFIAYKNNVLTPTLTEESGSKSDPETKLDTESSNGIKQEGKTTQVTGLPATSKTPSNLKKTSDKEELEEEGDQKDATQSSSEVTDQPNKSNNEKTELFPIETSHFPGPSDLEINEGSNRLRVSLNEAETTLSPTTDQAQNGVPATTSTPKTSQAESMVTTTEPELATLLIPYSFVQYLGHNHKGSEELTATNVEEGSDMIEPPPNYSVNETPGNRDATEGATGSVDHGNPSFSEGNIEHKEPATYERTELSDSGHSLGHPSGSSVVNDDSPNYEDYRQDYSEVRSEHREESSDPEEIKYEYVYDEKPGYSERYDSEESEYREENLEYDDVRLAYSEDKSEYDAKPVDIPGYVVNPGYSDSKPEYANTKPGYSEVKPEYDSVRSEYSEENLEYDDDGTAYSEDNPNYHSVKSEYGEGSPGYDVRPGYSEAESEYDSVRSDYGEEKTQFDGIPGYSEGVSKYDGVRPGYGEDRPQYDGIPGYSEDVSDDADTGYSASGPENSYGIPDNGEDATEYRPEYSEGVSEENNDPTKYKPEGGGPDSHGGQTAMSRKDDEGQNTYGGDSPFFIKLPGSPNAVPVFLQYEPVQVKYIPLDKFNHNINQGGTSSSDSNRNSQEPTPIRLGAQGERKDALTEVMREMNDQTEGGDTESLYSVSEDSLRRTDLIEKTPAERPTEGDSIASSLMTGIYRILDDVSLAVNNYQRESQTEASEYETSQYGTNQQGTTHYETSQHGLGQQGNIQHGTDQTFTPHKPVVKTPDPFFLMEAPQLGSHNPSHNPEAPGAVGTPGDSSDGYKVRVSSKLGFEAQSGGSNKGVVEDVPIGAREEILYPGDYYIHDSFTGINLTSLINPIFDLSTKPPTPSMEERMNPQYTPFPITTNPPRSKATTESNPPTTTEATTTTTTSSTPSYVTTTTTQISTPKTPASVEFSPIPASNFDDSYDSDYIPEYFYDNENAIVSLPPDPPEVIEAPVLSTSGGKIGGIVHTDTRQVSAAPLRISDEAVPTSSTTKTTTTVTTTSSAVPLSDEKGAITENEDPSPPFDFEAHQQLWSFPQRHEGPPKDPRYKLVDVTPEPVYRAFYSPMEIPGFDPRDFGYRKIPGNYGHTRGPHRPQTDHHVLGPQFFKYLSEMSPSMQRGFLDPSPSTPLKRRKRETTNPREQIFCEWNIKTEQGLYLLMTFHNLSAPYTVDCHGAYIEVERENNGYDARWCGNRVSQAGSRPHVIFAKTEVRITVYDDGDTSKSFPTGFEADIEVIDLFDARDYTAFMRSNAYPHIRRLLLG